MMRFINGKIDFHGCSENIFFAKQKYIKKTKEYTSKQGIPR